MSQLANDSREWSLSQLPMYDGYIEPERVCTRARVRVLPTPGGGGGGGGANYLASFHRRISHTGRGGAQQLTKPPGRWGDHSTRITASECTAKVLRAVARLPPSVRWSQIFTVPSAAPAISVCLSALRVGESCCAFVLSCPTILSCTCSTREGKAKRGWAACMRHDGCPDGCNFRSSRLERMAPSRLLTTFRTDRPGPRPAEIA